MVHEGTIDGSINRVGCVPMNTSRHGDGLVEWKIGCVPMEMDDRMAIDQHGDRNVLSIRRSDIVAENDTKKWIGNNDVPEGLKKGSAVCQWRSKQRGLLSDEGLVC